MEGKVPVPQERTNVSFVTEGSSWNQIEEFWPAGSRETANRKRSHPPSLKCSGEDELRTRGVKEIADSRSRGRTCVLRKGEEEPRGCVRRVEGAQKPRSPARVCVQAGMRTPKQMSRSPVAVWNMGERSR